MGASSSSKACSTCLRFLQGPESGHTRMAPGLVISAQKMLIGENHRSRLFQARFALTRQVCLDRGHYLPFRHSCCKDFTNSSPTMSQHGDLIEASGGGGLSRNLPILSLPAHRRIGDLEDDHRKYWFSVHGDPTPGRNSKPTLELE